MDASPGADTTGRERTVPTDVAHRRSPLDGGRVPIEFESAPSAMLVVDETGRIVLANALAERLFGYPREELLGRAIELLVPERLRERHVEERTEYLAAPLPRPMGTGRELFGLRRDGREIPLEIGLNPISTDAGRFVLAAVVDISERVRAEQSFRAVFDAAPSAMLIVSAEGCIVEGNALAAAMFGYRRDELRGLAVDALVPERFRGAHAAHRAHFFAAPGARPMGADRELFARRRDGVEFPVEIGLSPLATPDGTLVLAAVVDIGERRRAQRALAAKNDEVEAFVYTVSHDLRTPLVNVQGFGSEIEHGLATLREALAHAPLDAALRARVTELLDDELAASLRYVTAGASQLERLIDALLRLSRTGRQDYRPEALDMTALASATRDAARKLAQARGAEVLVHELPPAWGDRTAIGQVLSNLTTNALTYLDARRPGRVEIGGREGDWMNEFWVRDNGVGIPPSARPRLFQAFQRFHPEIAPGDGMGLITVKRIVERHGGSVRVDSEEGAGTTFSWTLPGQADGAA